MQKRCPVGTPQIAPSEKTCPRCPPQLWQRISLHFLSYSVYESPGSKPSTAPDTGS